MRFLVLPAVLLLGAALLAPVSTAQTTPAPDTIRVDNPQNQARAMFNEGNELLRLQNFEGALAKFEAGIARHESNARNHFGRGVALAQLNRRSDALTSFSRASELALDQGDDELSGAINRQMSALALVEAAELMREQPLTDQSAQRVVEILTPVESTMGDNATFFYYLARAHNTLGAHDQASRSASRAIELSAGQSQDLSAVHYEHGYAEMNLGNEATARAAFEAAMTGAYAGWAEYQLGVLDANGAAEASAVEDGE